MPKDRKPTTKERQNPTHPLPPLNSSAIWSFASQQKAIDLYWDDPAAIPNNSGFDILGVNVYRSFDSEYGPYFRLNQNPIGATFYRDATTIDDVVDENVSTRFLARGDENGDWIFRVQNYPMVKPGDPKVTANSADDVTVTIDGQEVKAARVYGETGEVQLQTAYEYDAATNQRNDPVLPHANSVVTCSYSYNTNLISNELFQRTFYRITTVGYDQWDGQLKETPLNWTSAVHIHETEKLDYIWKDAIRRNRWILDQGGERVKAFIHKYRGVQCGCYARFDDPHPYNQCEVCFGTGVKGGYEGPYEILLAPADGARSIRQSDRGRGEEKTYNTWTGPQPLMSQRDFIVKLNGDRYSIGPVSMPTNRGTVLQQHFDVNLLAKNDIRHLVPVTGTDSLAFPETRTMDHEDDPDETRYPQITDSDSSPDGIEERGRTPVWENINS